MKAVENVLQPPLFTCASGMDARKLQFVDSRLRNYFLDYNGRFRVVAYGSSPYTHLVRSVVPC